VTLPETFTFPWAKAPLSLNQRLHHMQKAKITKDLRTLMAVLAGHLEPVGRCEVELVWIVGDKRRRDSENPVPTLKALCDGLVDAGLVPDDVPEHMWKLMPVIRYVKGATPHFEFTVRELS
jgi:hypothetical protein